MEIQEKKLVDSESTSIWIALKKNWIALLLLIGASLLYGGINIGNINHGVQIPAVLRWNNPDLYNRDYYGEYLSRYYSLFWITIALATRYIGITASLLIAHLISRVLMFTGLFSLGYSFFRKSSIALVGVTLTILNLDTILVTNAELLDTIPTHTTFVFSLIPWTILLFYKRNTIGLALILGLICQFNLMNGLLMIIVYGGAAIINWRDFWNRRSLAAVSLLLLIISNELYWALSTSALDVPMTEYIQALKEYAWTHLFPLSWNTNRWIRLSGLLVMVALCIIIKGALPHRRLTYGIFVAIALTWATAFIVSLPPSLQRFTTLQWCRTCSILVVLMVPCVAYLIVETLPKLNPVKFFPTCSLMGAAWFYTHGYRQAMLMLLICAIVIFWNIHKTKNKNFMNKIFYVGSILIIIYSVNILTPKFINNIATNGFTIKKPDQSWVAAQIWAQQNTDVNAYFLTRSDGQDFRTYSQRAVYCTDSNRNIFLLVPKFTGQTLQRIRNIKELGLDEKPYTNFSWAKAVQFCQNNKIDYIVLPIYLDADIEPRFKNQDWAIYQIPRLSPIDHPNK
ncbi:MAG: hypothetical protein GY869_03450 [Planctomycetes bacterium]|nr:hypothetical protein [Planctomycetota bacterium]